MDESIEKEHALELLGKYSKTVIEHVTNPRNVGDMPNYDGYGQEVGDCGDILSIWISVRNDRVVNITFWTDGCGATIACGSMVTELVKGRSISEAYRLTPENILDALGGLPEENVHCASFAVNSLRKALQNYTELRKFPWKKLYQ